MDDDAPKAPDVPTEPAPAPAERKTVFGLPLDMFVKGGTTSYRHDMHIKEVEADAERRRDEAAAERQIASIPVEEGGGKLYTNKLTDNPDADQAYVLLKFVNRKGEETGYQCLADVLMNVDPGDPKNLTLQLVCPRCKENGVPQGQAQRRIHQSNKRWFLDQRKAGELFPFDDGFGVKMYQSAGEIMECERFTCSDCSWSARIDRNRIWTD